MKVVAKHKFAPLVALDDGSVVDTEDLEVIGNGDVEGDDWDFETEVEMDPRWEEIAQADAANLGVTEKKVATGSRTFRAPSHVREHLKTTGLATPLADGKGLPLEELETLVEDDAFDGPAEDWVFGVLNKHGDNPDADEEYQLFSAAEPELDYDEIDAAMDEGDAQRDADPNDYNDDDAIVAAIEAPPGDFSKVVYIAFIEEDDDKSVQDLAALASGKNGAASAFIYKDKGWVESPETITKLQSSAPPPIRQLEDWQVESVLEQIKSTENFDENAPNAEEAEAPDAPATETPAAPAAAAAPAVQASAFELLQGGVIWGPDNKRILSVVTADGGADRNRGNAETLRRYWTVGKGAAKIRWAPNSGAYTRCVRHLSKYLGTRAHGYCALRMHEVLGIWPGSKINDPID